MLSFGTPSGLWLLLGALPVLLLYFLRTRFRRRPVGSIFIWKRLADRTSGGRRPRRRSLLLLFLQLAAVALSALAAASPFFATTRTSPPGLAILVDVSASMATRDGAVGASGAIGAYGAGEKLDRVGRAVDLALAEIRKLPPGAPLALFACGARLREIAAVGTDRAAAGRALGSLAATDEGFDEPAMAAELESWLAFRGEYWNVLLVTDGGLELGGDLLSSAVSGALGGSFRAILVAGGPGEAGVSGLRLERGPAGKSGIAHFALWNPGAAPLQLSVSLFRDGEARALASAKILAPPSWSRGSLEFKGSVYNGGYSLVLDGAPDWAPGAVSRLAVNPARPTTVLIVGSGDPYLRAALAGSGVVTRSAERFPDSAEAPAWDLVIADRVSPPPDYPGDLLAFGLPPPGSPLEPAGEAAGRLGPPARPEALSRFADWGEARVDGARVFSVGPGARVVATVDGKPVIAAWEAGGRKRVFCGVDLGRSDLVLKSAFPVFISNILSWCVPPSDPQSAWTLRVGERVIRPGAPSFAVAEPDSVEVLREGSSLAVTAREAGFFRWEAEGQSGTIAADPPASEMDALPRPLRGGESENPVSKGSSSTAEIAATAATAVKLLSVRIGLSLWPIAALILCLAAEWLVWRGRLSGRRENAE